MTIYGIKTCSTVGKAKKFMKENGIEFDFVDYKVESVDEEKIREWLKEIDMKILFNTRGTKYRDLKLKALNLDDEGKISWMAKENYLIKRPIVEYDNGKVHVAYNEDIYKETFLN
jgi:Spx/MgsR family transcriptional regulator